MIQIRLLPRKVRKKRTKKIKKQRQKYDPVREPESTTKTRQKNLVKSKNKLMVMIKIPKKIA
jgi:hypothetical protein